MKIEIPSIEDLEAIDKIAVQVHELHVTWRPDLFEHTDSIFSLDGLKTIIENKDMYIARKDKEVVGYILLSTKEGKKNGYRYRKVLNIEAMGVEKQYRNQGIGTQLLNYVKEYAKENGYTDLLLSVNEENVNAISLYEKMGFKIKNISYSLDIK